MSEGAKNVWSAVGILITSVMGLAVFFGHQTVQTLNDWRESESAHVEQELQLRVRSLRTEEEALTQRERLLDAVIEQRKALDQRNETLDELLPILLERLEIVQRRDAVEDAIRAWTLVTLKRFGQHEGLDLPKLPKAVREDLKFEINEIHE